MKVNHLALLNRAFALSSCLLISGYSTNVLAQVIEAPASEEIVEEIDPNEVIGSNDGWKFGGELSAIARFFTDAPLYWGQYDGAVPIVEGRIATSYTWGGGSHRLALEAFGRYDGLTDTSVFDLPEANYQYVGEGLEFLAGSHIEFWGVAESYNPVNIINQTDINGDVRGKTRLGQPMVKLDFGNEQAGNLSLLALIGFRQRKFGDYSSRFRSPFVTDEHLDTYEDEDNKHFDYAARYSNSVDLGAGSLDFAVSYFNGTNRDPVLLPACLKSNAVISSSKCKAFNQKVVKIYESHPDFPGGSDEESVRDFVRDHLDDDLARKLSKVAGIAGLGTQPYYQELQQIGLETVYGTGNFQAKFEGAWKKAYDEDYISTAFGFEYAINNVWDSQATLSLIGEYLYDDRSIYQPYTFYDNDVFGAFRVGFNDVNNTQLMAGLFVDVDTSATIGVLEFSTRLTDSLKLGVEANIFNTNGWNDILATVRRDSYVDLKLTAFF